MCCPYHTHSYDGYDHHYSNDHHYSKHHYGDNINTNEYSATHYPGNHNGR